MFLQNTEKPVEFIPLKVEGVFWFFKGVLKFSQDNVNMLITQTFAVFASVYLVYGQRSPFAGSRPIGYPELTGITEGLGNRFDDGTTQRLPVEALGDRELVDRLSKLPIDKQPFWFINWQALEANRQKPQTYPLRPNPFLENGSPSDTSGSINVSNSAGVNSNSASTLGNRSGDSDTTTTNNVKENPNHFKAPVEKETKKDNVHDSSRNKFQY